MAAIPSDAGLVHASLDGELSAFEELVKRYQDILYRNALCYLHRPDDAQDMVQEAFLKAFQELDRLNDPEKFGFWIGSIVRNACLNALRSRRQENAAHDEIRETLVKPDSNSQGNRATEEYREGSVQNLLSRLPDKSARAFAMHYIEELPIDIIAQQLGSSVQSVKQRLYRARRQLQQEIVKMAKDSFEREKLPDNFPARVVAHLLETGRNDRLYMCYNRAMERFQEALKAAPEDPEVLLEIGRSYDPMRWPGRKDVETLERAAALAPGAIEVMCALETAYRQPGHEQAHDGVFRKCLDLCERRLAEDPEEVKVLKLKAKLLMGSGEYAEVEKILQTVTEHISDDQEAHYCLALSMGRQQRYEDASERYMKAYELNPKTVWAYFSLRQLATHLAFRKGESEKAVELMEEIWRLTQRPDEAGNLIYFYSATEQLQKAVEVFKTVETYTHHPRVYVTVGIGYMKEGENGEAERVLRYAIESTNDSSLRSEAQLHLARALFTQGKFQEARQMVENGLRLDVSRRTALAQKKTSAFWLPWTKWLSETLASLHQYDLRVKTLYQTVRKELDQI